MKKIIQKCIQALMLVVCVHPVHADQYSPGMEDFVANMTARSAYDPKSVLCTQNKVIVLVHQPSTNIVMSQWVPELNEEHLVANMGEQPLLSEVTDINIIDGLHLSRDWQVVLKVHCTNVPTILAYNPANRVPVNVLMLADWPESGRSFTDLLIKYVGPHFGVRFSHDANGVPLGMPTQWGGMTQMELKEAAEKAFIASGRI